ncbi:hypothetical protein TELCIR_06543 [Teladorsagia circumcincta]|uniref:G-protein coupled receptors family 1 profile domain-containing protein n=1 Tax=Teladorsagia circumcincta TaxID=45464 RepID=A0A2G9UMR5_TELCI|nr:hypothetical protein TELCIR_06543 [Teladorsagia circumcincta]
MTTVELEKAQKPLEKQKSFGFSSSSQQTADVNEDLKSYLLGRTTMAGPHGLAAPPEIQPTSTSAAASLSLSSSPVTLPFRNTQLFQLVMKLLSTSADNATSQTVPVDVSDFPYGDESRMVAIIVFGAVFAIVTFVGNLMVMVSFKIDKQLQTISNYFLFSLAVADIAIGTRFAQALCLDFKVYLDI